MATYKDTLDLLSLRAFFPLSGNSPWVDSEGSGVSYTGSGAAGGSLMTTTDLTLGSVINANATISTADNSAIKLDTPCSIAFSAKFSDSTTTSDGYFIGDNSSNSFSFYRDYTGGTRVIKILTSSNIEGTIINGYTPDQIYHFVVTISLIGIIVYVDGVNVYSRDFNHPIDKYINRLSVNYSYATIGNLSTHNITLSPEEVLKLYTATRHENITINGTISESLLATDFKVMAHRLDNGDLSASTTTNTGSFNVVVPDIPHYVVCLAEQGVMHETGHAYSLGDKVYPSDMVNYPYYYECTTAGTSGATVPVWDTTLLSTTNDGTVVWTIVEHLIQPVAHSPLVS